MFVQVQIYNVNTLNIVEHHTQIYSICGESPEHEIKIK